MFSSGRRDVSRGGSQTRKVKAASHATNLSLLQAATIYKYVKGDYGIDEEMFGMFRKNKSVLWALTMVLLRMIKHEKKKKVRSKNYTIKITVKR